MLLFINTYLLLLFSLPILCFSSLTRFSLSLTLSLTTASPSLLSSQPFADSTSLSLSPSLSPSPLPLSSTTDPSLPPPTDDSNGRSGGNNGRPDSSKSGGRSDSVGLFTFRWVSFGLGFLMGLDCFWVGFPGEFWLILSWIFQWVCLDFKLGFLIAFPLILG